MAQAYTSGYKPYEIADFSGGVNLRDKADTVGDKDAIDLLNVTFNERGAIRQRDGFADLTPVELANRVDSLSAFYTASGLRHLIAGAGARLEAIDSAGNLIGSQTGLAGGPYSFARTAAPGREYLYAANGLNTLQRWDGTNFTAPTAVVDGVAGREMPRAGSITTSAAAPGGTASNNANNRLIATAFGTQTNAGPGGAATTPSTVWFSNPGAPETWETDGDPTAVRGRNFMELTPGDGERIMAAVTWRELVFVFKETKFFVLWGESLQADFTPKFEYREVVNAVGLASAQAITVGRDGVYFFNRRGVYRTNGSDPVLLSDKLTPLWLGGTEVYYQGQAINLGHVELVRMAWHMEQLFVAVPTGTRDYNDRLLVYDLQAGWWTIYDIAASALATFRRQSQPELHHGYATGPKRIGHRSFGADTDRDQGIVSRWRSGWTEYELPVQKTFRETKVWGSGALTVSFSVDFERGQRASADVIYGMSNTWPIGTVGVTYNTVRAGYATYQQVRDHNANYALLRSEAP